MRLVIMRHGEAEARFSNDAQRQLTTRGYMESQSTGLWLRDTYGTFDFALVSPYIRAVQTFEMIAPLLEVNSKEISSDLVPSGDPELVHDYVRVIAQEHQYSSMIIVSHMPLVSYLLGSFCGDNHAQLFTTAGVYVLDCDWEQNRTAIENAFSPELDSMAI